MVKRQIVIYTGFNTAMFPHVGNNKDGVHHSLTEEWIATRAKIWRDYTWKSILNQNYEDWFYCLRCHSAAKAITDKCFGDISDERFVLVYPEGTIGMPENESKVMSDISMGMNQMVNVRIDSDDMYHPTAISELHRALYSKSHDWFMWRNGYCYQYNEKNPKMKQYRAPSTPFLAKRYNTGEWLEQKEIRILCQHHLVVKRHHPKFLSDKKIMVGITGLNSSTLFKNSCFKGKIYEPEKTSVLKEFGIL